MGLRAAIARASEAWSSLRRRKKNKDTTELSAKVDQQHSSNVLLVIGVILHPLRPCQLRLGDTDAAAPVYQCVVGKDVHRASPDPLVIRVPCPEIGKPYDAMQRTCLCKTRAWFEYAALRWSDARFVAKIEDDTIVHWAGLTRFLVGLNDSPMSWIGSFQWAVHTRHGSRGKYCSAAREHLRGPPHRCLLDGHDDVLAPYPTGAADVRGQDLNRRLLLCQKSHLGSCDGGQGMIAATCLRPNETIHLFHWTDTQYKRTPLPSTLVSHPNKNKNGVRKWTVNASVQPIAFDASTHINTHGQLVLGWSRARSSGAHAPSRPR